MMKTKKAEKRDGFSVDIYKKKGNKAELVFRKNKAMLYRLKGIEGCESVTKQFETAVAENGKADVIELRHACGRRWAVELVSTLLKGVVLVWELMSAGISVLRFMWQGPVEEFKNAFS